MQFAGWVDEFAGIDVPSDLAGLDAALFHQDTDHPVMKEVLWLPT